MTVGKGVSRVKRRWLTLDEAAMELGGDVEGVRQAMEAGDLFDLPTFVYSGTGRLPARLFCVPEDEPSYELPGDPYGDAAPISWREDSPPGWFLLTGFFRVSPPCIGTIARKRTLFECSVCPDSWWEPNSSASKYDNGEPLSQFILCVPPAELPGGYRVEVRDMDSLFNFDKLRFRAEDIAAFRANHLGAVDATHSQSPPAAKSAASARWPWGSHETEALRHLEAAARKWWSHYDPTDPTSASTNEQVVAWLIEEHGVSMRLANSIASILRADGLPSGPRR